MLCLEAAVRYGSISKAAEKNNMKQSNMSVQIKQLEEELGEPLIQRVYNGVQLTQIGKEIYSLACDLESVINKTKEINAKSFPVSGAIRFWTSDGLGISYISECFASFYMDYPKVNIEIISSLDMPKFDEFDMAIVYKKPVEVDFEVVNSYDLKFDFFATKEYLAKYGYPKSLKDIQENHRLCTRNSYAGVWPKWNKFIENTHKVVATTNSSSMLLQLVKNSIGIALLPKYIGEKEGLVSLSKIKMNLNHKFWILVRKDIKNVDKIKALIGFIENVSEKL